MLRADCANSTSHVVYQAIGYRRAGGETLDKLEGLEEGEALVRLVDAEALLANGRGADARGALEAAARGVHERAVRLHDPALRESFLTRAPENVRTLELARDALPG